MLQERVTSQGGDAAPPARSSLGALRTAIDSGLTVGDGSATRGQLVGRAEAALHEAKPRGRDRTLIAQAGRTLHSSEL